jgi:hypothetical protein
MELTRKAFSLSSPPLLLVYEVKLPNLLYSEFKGILLRAAGR